MMEAPPSAALIVAEADFLFEFLIVALDARAQLGEVDESAERHALVDGCEPEFCVAQRPGSPRWGSSTLTTSAPSHASASVQDGPASNCVRSSTLTPSSADWVSVAISGCTTCSRMATLRLRRRLWRGPLMCHLT